MAVANTYPEAEVGGRGKKVKLNLDFSSQYISQARTVLKHAPDLSGNVLSGATTLNDAYKTALQRKKAAESGDEALLELREKAPDLADSDGADFN